MNAALRGRAQPDPQGLRSNSDLSYDSLEEPAMGLFSGSTRESSVPDFNGNTGQSSLDPPNQNHSFWSERVFEVDDLNLSSLRTENGDLLLASLRLQRAESDSFGINQNPTAKPLLLSLKLEKKEVALFTGLLGRQIRVEEELRPSFRAKEEMELELQQLRDEVAELSDENQVLKRSLMEIQRPRRVS